MQLIFVHHAMRKVKTSLSQDDDITSLGKRDAKNVRDLLFILQKKRKIFKIYSSPFKRCIKTAKIINSKVNAPISLEPRLNEFRSVEGETWVDLQKRMKEALLDIVKECPNDAAAVCVTSGVNIVSFFSLAAHLEPSEDAPFIAVPSCSPIGFNIDKDKFFAKND